MSTTTFPWHVDGVAPVGDDPTNRVSALDVPPELINKMADDALKAPKPEYPVIEAVPPTGLVVELPCGYMNFNEEIIKEAEVRELTGVDEEALAKIPSKNAGRLLFEILKRGVVRIGDSPVNPGILAQLLVADRDYLLMAIRQATYGDQVPYRLNCPECGREGDMILELSKDVPIKKLDGPRVRTVTLRNGRVANVSLLTTEASIDDEINKNGVTIPEANTFLLTRMVIDIAGKKPSRHDILNLGRKDRAALVEAMSERYGLDYEAVKLPCPHCEHEMPVVFGLADLL